MSSDNYRFIYDNLLLSLCRVLGQDKVNCCIEACFIISTLINPRKLPIVITESLECNAPKHFVLQPVLDLLNLFTFLQELNNCKFSVSF